MINEFKIFESLKNISKEDLVASFDKCQEDLPITIEELDDMIVGIIGYSELIKKYHYLRIMHEGYERKILIKSEDIREVPNAWRMRSVINKSDIYSLWKKGAEASIYYIIEFGLATDIKEYTEDFIRLRQRCRDMGFDADTGYQKKQTELFIEFIIPVDKSYFLPEIEDHKDLPSSMVEDFETFCQKNAIVKAEQRAELIELVKKAKDQ